jgi:hypothetical protein
MVFSERRLMLRRAAQAAVLGAVTAVTARASGASGSRRLAARVWADPVGLRWIAAQPVIVPRSTWDTVVPHRGPLPAPRYASAVKAAFVHHTDNGNGYGAGEVRDIIWSIFDDHTTRQGWDDIGYNFLVDRFGTIYEGRHGGIELPVIGAHCTGFNIGTAGIAAIGTFTEGAEVPAPMLRSISALVAWKLSLAGVDPRSSATLTCNESGSRYPAGSRAVFAAVSGHIDADFTYCPGSALYAALPQIRLDAATIQQSTTHPVFNDPAPLPRASPSSTSPPAAPSPRDSRTGDASPGHA